MLFDIALGLGVSFVLLFVLSIILKDNSIADVFWGLGFLQVSIHSFILAGAQGMTRIILLGLIALWAFRISGYIFSKKLVSKGEDLRYAKWRESWNYFYLRSFFQVYVLQGALLLLVSTAIMVFMKEPSGLTPFFLLSLAVSLFGLGFEAVADYQLNAFMKTKKKGEIMKSGLWKYSRHPNYFGESVFWLGVSLMALPSSPLALMSWGAITVLLRFVSGVPLAEERMKENKEYQEYQKKTPPMIPNPFIK